MGQARVLVTGSCGLIGSEVCLHFHQAGYSVLGVDNNQRAVFFGPEGDTSWSLQRLRQTIPGYEHHHIDIRDRESILRLVESTRPAVIVHTAAQPSHDRAAQIAFDDFDTNAVGTLNLLEAARRWTPESPFIHMSTNKVYGDRPNMLALLEKETRWDYADAEYGLFDHRQSQALLQRPAMEEHADRHLAGVAGHSGSPPPIPLFPSVALPFVASSPPSGRTSAITPLSGCAAGVLRPHTTTGGTM